MKLSRSFAMEMSSGTAPSFSSLTFEPSSVDSRVSNVAPPLRTFRSANLHLSPQNHIQSKNLDFLLKNLHFCIETTHSCKVVLTECPIVKMCCKIHHFEFTIPRFCLILIHIFSFF